MITASISVHIEGVRTLPPRNLWFTLQERAGDLDGYAEDVRRAWNALTTDASSTALEEHLLYALMMATTASLASSVPPRLLSALVEHGVWTLRQALAYVHRAPSAEGLAFGLIQLSDFMEEPGLERVVQDVEYYVEGVPDPEARFNLTLWLAARGSEPERLGRVREALRIAAQAGDRFRPGRCLRCTGR